MDSEWIEHHGKGYPDLPRDALVRVRFADGVEELNPWPVADWNVNWRHSSPIFHADITHYRLA